MAARDRDRRGTELLERASVDPAPLEAVRAALREGRPAEPARTCAPSEEEAILEATIRHAYELAAPAHPVQAPGTRCVEAWSREGPIAIAPRSDVPPFERFEVASDAQVASWYLERAAQSEGRRVWIGEGPVRYVLRTEDWGPRGRELILHVLRRVGGEWRVLTTILLAAT